MLSGRPVAGPRSLTPPDPLLQSLEEPRHVQSWRRALRGCLGQQRAC